MCANYACDGGGAVRTRGRLGDVGHVGRATGRRVERHFPALGYREIAGETYGPRDTRRRGGRRYTIGRGRDERSASVTVRFTGAC